MVSIGRYIYYFIDLGEVREIACKFHSLDFDLIRKDDFGWGESVGKVREPAIQLGLALKNLFNSHARGLVLLEEVQCHIVHQLPQLEIRFNGEAEKDGVLRLT